MHTVASEVLSFSQVESTDQPTTMEMRGFSYFSAEELQSLMKMEQVEDNEDEEPVDPKTVRDRIHEWRLAV